VKQDSRTNLDGDLLVEKEVDCCSSVEQTTGPQASPTSGTVDGSDTASDRKTNDPLPGYVAVNQPEKTNQELDCGISSSS
jgi:hypothetical protein